jgi:anti-sigma B factor antagonist
LVDGHLSIVVREQDRATVIALDGELDIASSPRLEEQIVRVLRSGAELVVLDLEDLKFMDVTSLRVLVSSHQQAQQSTKRLVLVNVGAQVRRLMILTRLIDVLSVLEGPVELPQS